MPRGIYERKPRVQKKLRSNASTHRIHRVPSDNIQTREGELRQFLRIHAGMVALAADSLRHGVLGGGSDTIQALFDIAQAMRMEAEH